RTIEHAGTNLLSIINDILDFSKIESGKLEIIPKDYLFSSLLNDVINIIRTRVYESHLRFAVYIDNNIPNELYGDFIRLRQLMLNILSNAVKFTDQGHISLSVSGKITDSSTVVLVIEVSDTGKGIKQEDIAKLFTEFIRVDMSSNMNIEGTGLGLAISHNIVKAMGGNIDVSSVYGKGSTFTVSLPQQIRNNNKIAVVENAKEKKSLIFERRELYVNSIAKALDSLDVDYKIASSEEEFLNDAGNNEFQHIFISSVLYALVKKKYKELASKAKLLVITEFGESAREQNINIISSPVFSLPIANFLNGVTNRNYYKSNYETIIGFTAPDASVLVVDDLYTNLKVAEGLMLPYCMKIDLCDSGSKAMDMLKTRRYDLVLMDHMMPGMDGIEVTEQIRALGENDDYYKKLPIIALTANAVSGIREFFLENDLNDFLPKPIDTSMLNSMLEMWIPREKQIRSTVSNNGKTIIMENNNTVDFRIKGLNINKGIMMSGGIKENYLSTGCIPRGWKGKMQ
ncbi:MAG: ATP-binding protein, partial [Treponema sp.]|nr:ATP-binding protein [Treponema sp.]